MAKLKLYRGAKSSIPSAKEDGALYVASDTREMFLDVDSSTRIQISNIQVVADMTELSGILAPISTMFYYVTAKNQFYKYISSAWKCLGSDLTALVIGSTAAATSNGVTTNSTTYLNLVVDGTVVSSHKITGSGSTTVTGDANGNLLIYSAGGGSGTGKTIYDDTEPNPVTESMSVGDVWMNFDISITSP